MKFEYIVTLKKGYSPVLSSLYNEPDEVDEVRFVIETRNMANANRMVKAMLATSENVVDYSGICIE